MKHLKLFFALFAMLALGVGNAWGATYSLTPNKAGTGLSNTAYITSLTEFTNNGISWKMNQWNPSTLQIKTNQSSATSEWRFYNTTAMPGKITKVVIKFSALTLKNTSTTGFKFVGGSAAVTGTTGGTDGVWNASAKTLTWTPAASDNFTYFALYQNGQVASGTNKLATSDAIVVTYETSGDEETVPSLTEEQFSWSAVAATATLPNQFDEKPTLKNTEGLDVTYSTSNDKVATIDASGNVTLIGVGTADIKATAGDGVTFEKTTVSYTLTVKPAPLVIEPIEGGIIDILTHKTFAASSNQYTNFTGKQAANENHSDAVYAGKTARNGNATQYSIQLNTIDKGRIATTTTGGLAKRVYVKWSTQETLNTNARELYIYGSNTAFTGNETTASTKIGAIKYTTGAAEAYVDLTGDYKFILITGSGAIYMDEIQVTWVSAAGTVVTPTISGETEFVESTEVSIATETGYKVYYTLDGTEPTDASTEYTAPFTVTTTTTVKAVAYDGTSASDVVSATFKALEILTCEAAAEKCAATESTDKYVIRGYVTSIAYAYSTSDNNVTFWMADTKNGGEVLYAYRVKPEEETDKLVIVGDQVQVIGKIKTYSGKKEVNTGTYTITVPNPKYNVNITSAHGTVTATPASAVEGTEITLSVDVESGWVFQSWTVTDASSNPIEVTDNKFTMPASDVTVVANYTESVAPDAVLKLSANGTIISEETYKVGETVKLPDNIANDCVKMFVGWSANANCATAPEYAPGADFELTAEEHTLYAVYANGTTGETVTIKHNVPTTGTSTNMTGNNDANKFFDLDADAWSVVAAKGGASNNVGINKDGTIRLYYHVSGGNTLTVTAPSKVATIKLTYNGTYTNAWVKVNGNKVTPADGVYTIDAETFVIGNANTESAQVHIKNIAVTLAGELADFSTTCSGALAAPTFSVAEGEYTEAKSITLSADKGTIYYTLDGTTPTSASTQYTEAIVLDKCGEYTIKAIAINSESESPVASATYTISLPIPANDADNPYTGTEAIEVYNGGCYDGETLVYITGTVQEVEYSSSYGNYEITFADGFQCFRLQKTATEKFTEDIIGAGDVIVACGKLDKYGENYQLAAGCYLVKHTPSVKADAELAWNPETVTLTVGDVFTAPTLSNPHSVSGITYESSNEDVATVSAGVIALVDDAVGTATITASFLGDATYKPATATCTIKVKPVQEDCEGSDDFETLEVNSGYATRTSTAGWTATHAAVAEIEGSNYIIINGKTSTVGTITSPELNGGIGSIKIRYANTYGETNGVSFRLDIKQNGEVVKTYAITYKTGVTQNTVYTELIENINVAGDFQMVFTNLSPSKSTSNKDRVSIGRLCWTGYEEAPQEPTTVTLTYDLTPDAYLDRMGRRYVMTEDATLGDVQIILPNFNTETTEYAEAFLIVGSETLNATATYAADAENNLEVYTATATSEDGATIYNVTMNVTVPATQEYTFLATNGAEYVTEDWGEEGESFIVYTISGKGYLNDETVAFEMMVDQMGNMEGTINDVYVMGTATGLVEEEGTLWLQGTANDEGGNTYNIEMYVAQAVEEVEIVITAEVDVTLDKLTLELMGNMAMVTAGDEELSFWLTLLETENYYGTYSADMFNNIWYGEESLQPYGDGVYDQNGLVVSFISEPDADGNATKYNFTLKPETYTRTVTAGNFGTICLEFGSNNYTGAEFYELVQAKADGVVLASVETLKAGVPYIFKATATELAVYSDGTTAATPGDHNGLHGTFTDDTEVAVGNYILKDNALCQAEATCYVNKNRAYVVMSEVPTEPVQQMPGRKYIGMDVNGENEATGVEDIFSTDAPVKVIENGQLIIIRGGEKFNAQGVRF